MKEIIYIYIKCLLVSAAMLVSCMLWAQSDARLDREKIQTGDRITCTFTIPMSNAGKLQTIESREDTLVVISNTFDTVNKNGVSCLACKCVFTSFIEGNYSLNIAGKSLQFIVVPYPIDTTKTVIKDIHPQATESFSLSEIKPILICVIIFLVLILAFFVGIKLYRKYNIKDIKHIFVKPKPKEAADIIALRELEHLRLERLVQNGRVKDYFSVLTDVLREYLLNRYSIPAIEMTSNEIISALQKHSDISIESNNVIKEILRNSDLVKFAKMIPDSYMCDRCMQDAVDFVNNTKIVLSQTQEEQTKKMEESNV